MKGSTGARLAALEKLRAALRPKPQYRIFRQDLDDAGSYLDDAGRAYSRAEIDALGAAGEKVICIEYSAAWPPGGE